jgi:colanic acid/amylovoran biosynthesis glycosyltransferase
MSSQRPHIAIVSINRDKYSETFIHDSFDYFPCTKTLLYGGYLPTQETDDWRKEGQAIPMAVAKLWERKPSDAAAQQVRNLHAWLQRTRPAVVLAHYGPSGVALAPICKALSIPLVVHFHGYDAYRSDVLSSYGQDYALLWAVAHRVVAVSADMHRQLSGLGAPAARLQTLVYGVDPAQFLPQAMPTGPLRCLFVGRFVPKKAPDQLIRAFARLRERVPDAALVMVGDGELLADCIALVHELGLGESVTFTGVLSPSAVAAQVAACHMLVLPSRRTDDGDSEGTPLVILEAGAAARPVVGTVHGGIPDVVQDGETGLLVPENDVHALAEAMLRLAQAPATAATMGAAAHARILAQFTQSDYHQALWQLLMHAAQGK